MRDAKFLVVLVFVPAKMDALRIQWDRIVALSYPEKRITALTNVGAVLLMALSPFYRNRALYFVNEYDNPDDNTWHEIEHVIGEMEHQIMSSLVGMIVPHVIGSFLDVSLLPCDGSMYMREDFPLLYAAIDSVFRLDADTFFVPDMRDKFPLGSGDIFSVSEIGGEAEHRLTLDEIPAHSHSEISSAPTIINGGLEAPASAATPSLAETGFSGGNMPHNNMPPYSVVKFAIVAG